MLTIRLTRKGKKNQPFFRVVVIDKRRSSKGGRAVEDLGYVNPLIKKMSLNKERILHWISKGAQPSATIHNLLISEKITGEAKKIHVSKLSKKKKAEMESAANAKKEAKKAEAVQPAAEKEEAKLDEIVKPAEESKPEAKKPIEAEAETPDKKPSEPVKTENPVR